MQTVPGVPAMLHNCQILQNEMVHFVTNLQHYIMFEVCLLSRIEIESTLVIKPPRSPPCTLQVLQTSWKRFAQRLPTEPNLDSIIRAHDLYLDEVVQKVRSPCRLLARPKGGSNRCVALAGSLGRKVFGHSQATCAAVRCGDKVLQHPKPPVRRRAVGG